MNSRILSLIAVAVLAPIALWFWMQYCGTKILDTNYAQVDSREMFQRVLGFPVPKGVTVDTVAGHHGPGTGEVWMKLSGHDPAFSTLTSNMVPVDKGFKYSIPSGAFGIQKTFGEDARAAGWDQVENLSKPQVYMFQTARGSEHWNGDLVVDKSQHTAYLSANLIKSND